MSTQPYNPPIRRAKIANSRVFMIGISVILHVAVIAAMFAFGKISLPDFSTPFAMSIAEVPIRSSALPPINDDEGGKDAGAPNQVPPKPTPQAENKIEEPKIEEKKPEPEPKKEEKKPEPKREEPKPQPKKTETKPTPQPEKKIISPNSSKKTEIKPEPEPPKPTPQEVAKELETKRGTFKAEQNVAGTTQARYIASDSDPGGQGGPQLYRSVLIGRIAQWWTPPFTRRGDVRDCTVEFTVYSPPLPADAVNQNRTARITSVRIVKSSGDLEYDAKALDAIRRVPNWPPLPDSYKKDTLVVQCRFYLIGEGN